MKPELELQLQQEFPEFFRGLHNGDPRQTLMCFGCDCGNGWYNILYDACKQIKKVLQKYSIPLDSFVFVQIKEKFGCYDKKTKVLTKNGWKLFKDITYQDTIATLNKDSGCVEYQSPTDIISYKYKGKMYSLQTRGVNLCVTPNHNLFIAKGDYWNGKFTPPKKIEKEFILTTPDTYFGHNKKFQKSAKWEGAEEQEFILPEIYCNRSGVGTFKKRTYHYPKISFPMDAWLKFLGWYVAEGCTSKNVDIRIASNNVDGGKEKEKISNILKESGLDFATSNNDRSALTFRIVNNQYHYGFLYQLGSWLLSNCGHRALNKKVPNFIKNLSSRQIRLFLECLYQGDGHKMPTGYILYTISKKLAYDVLELLLKIGDCGSISHRKPGPGKIYNGKVIQGKHEVYEINWLTHSYYHNTSNKGMSKSSHEKWINYNDMVYCVTLPNHVIYVCREGKPVWCGNSYRLYFNWQQGIEYTWLEKILNRLFKIPTFILKQIHVYKWWHIHRVYNKVDQIIRDAEIKSGRTCEDCGQPSVVDKKWSEGAWIVTLCQKHLDEYYSRLGQLFDYGKLDAT